MKCSQKLCKRNSNITSSGNCAICQDAIDEAVKKFEQSKKKKQFEKVNVDLNLMITTHKKLEQGVKVDPGTLNVLMLGGIVNILCQSEALEQMEEKVKILEQENTTNKVKMEYLESWVVKQHEVIEDLNKKFSRLDKNGVLVKESRDAQSMHKKLLGIEIDVDSLKNSLKRKENTKPHPKSSLHAKKCKECGETFTQNSDLEMHVISEHGQEKSFQCEICDKRFVLEWRMRKHLKMHEEKITMCKFFARSEHCPFEEIGCTFSHEHQENYEKEEDLETISDDGDGESYELAENQCHLCKLQLQSRDDLYYHVETQHEDYHQGVLELIATRRNINFPEEF